MRVIGSTNISKNLKEKNYSLLQNKDEYFSIHCYRPTCKYAAFKSSNTIRQYFIGHYITVEIQLQCDPTVSDSV